jgi:hypothetical protein
MVLNKTRNGKKENNVWYRNLRLGSKEAEMQRASTHLGKPIRHPAQRYRPFARYAGMVAANPGADVGNGAAPAGAATIKIAVAGFGLHFFGWLLLASFHPSLPYHLHTRKRRCRRPNFGEIACLQAVATPLAVRPPKRASSGCQPKRVERAQTPLSSRRSHKFFRCPLSKGQDLAVFSDTTNTSGSLHPDHRGLERVVGDCR